MFCKSCGTDIGNSPFCPVCGTKIEMPNQVAPNPVVPNPVVPNPVAPVSVTPDNSKKKKEKKPGNGKKALIISIVALLVLAIIGGVVFFLLKNKEDNKEITLTEITCSNLYLVPDTETEITFTVKANVASDEIALYDDDDKVAKMYDNGKNGDLVANDLIYTCVAKVEKSCDETKSFEYKCKAGEVESEPITIYCFAKPDEYTAQQAKDYYNELAERVQSIEESFADESGYVPESSYDQLLSSITEELDQAKDDKIVLHYMQEENSLYVKMTSGLAMVYTPKDPDTDAIGEDVTATIMTMQPCFTQMGGNAFASTAYNLPEGVNYILEMMDVSAQNLRNILPNYKFQNSNNCDDDAVTLEKIRSFGPNQVILWHGHGYYDFYVKSCLVTGEEFDWDAWFWDPEYYANCVDNSIINSWLVGYDEVIISSRYIQKYCGDMTNSFVYLAACDSGRSALAEAFASKGAAVVANSKTILRSYNVAMLYGTVNEMLKVNPNNGKFYTLSEALQRAKATYGNDDSDSRYGGIGSTPVIFGGDAANNYRFAEEVPTGNISGKVCKASDRITAIGSATIEVYIDSVLYTSTTSDESGQYALELPIGDCEIKISANGYIAYSCYSNIRAGATNYMETFLMVEGDESQVGTASGKIINSLSGYGVPSANLKVYKNWNVIYTDGEPLATLTSDSDGNYTVELPYGNYTIVIEKDGYTKASFNIIVQGGESGNQDGTITPETQGNDYLITLTWGENPRDVDSHVQGKVNGESFHVYYSRKNQYYDGENICNLDYDDTSSYGPEHITLKAVGTEPYYYYLHRYAGSGSLATSGAKVTIEQNNVLIAEFHVPTNLGSYDYWNVFAIVDGEIVVNNTITSSPNTSYASTASEEW